METALNKTESILIAPLNTVEIIGDRAPASAYRPSKTQRKRTSEGFRDLAVELVELSPGRLARLTLPDEIRSTLAVTRAMTNHGARRRQLSFLGQMLQEVDVQALRDAITNADHGPSLKAAPPTPPEARRLEDLTEMESLAEMLLKGGDQEIFTLSSRLEPSKLQVLRQFLRKTKKNLPSGVIQDATRKTVVDFLSALD